MAKKRIVKKAENVIRDPVPLSLLMENVLEDLAEEIVNGLSDEGFVANAVVDNNNINTDLRTCIKDALRRCFRG